MVNLKNTVRVYDVKNGINEQGHNLSQFPNTVNNKFSQSHKIYFNVKHAFVTDAAYLWHRCLSFYVYAYSETLSVYSACVDRLLIIGWLLSWIYMCVWFTLLLRFCWTKLLWWSQTFSLKLNALQIKCFMSDRSCYLSLYLLQTKQLVAGMFW